MKIALFHHLPEGGAKIAMFEQIKRLRVKHSFDLFTFMEESGEYDVKKFCNKIFLFPYQVMPLKKHGMRRLLSDMNSFTTLKKIHKHLAKIIDKRGYDLVFVHPSRLTQAPYILRFLTTPSAYYCQEPLRIAYEYGLRFSQKVSFSKKLYEKFNRKIRRDIDRTNAESASLILTSSLYMQEYITMAYGIRSQLCPLGVDTKYFYPQKNTTRKGILFVGNKTWIDGYDLLTKAIEYLGTQVRSEIIHIQPGTDGRFKMSKAEMLKVYNSVQVTVCSAVLEPFGLTALESMACGTPVVAVNEAGYRETVVDTKTGFLCQRDPRVMSQKLRKILENAELCEKLGQAAREHVEKKWKWENKINILDEQLKLTATL